MSEMSSKEYPVPVGKKKRGKEGGKLISTSDKKIANAISWWDVSAFLLALKEN